MLKKIGVLLLTTVMAATLIQASSNNYFLKVEDDYVRVASEFMKKLSQKKYEEARNVFDDTMTKMVSRDMLKEMWEKLQLQMGEFEKQLGYRKIPTGKYEVILVASRFKTKIIDMKIVVDGQKKVAGISMAETTFNDGTKLLQEEAKQTVIKERIAPYADKKAFTEKEFEAGLEEWPLPAVLTMPKGKGPFPALVLVHGSGPNDRDETLFENKPFRELAWGLATRGIAVLRYDKRSFHYKAKLVPHLKTFTLNEETVDDAVAMLLHLAKEPKIDRNKIFVLGHSLGGMAIPRIARKDKYKRAAGFIVLAGAARPFEDLILEQFRYMVNLDGKVEAMEKTLLENTEKQVALIKSKKLTVDTPPGQLIPGTFGAYWLDLRGYRPAHEAARMKRPMLILQGGRDYNVTMEDFNIWKSKLSHRKNVKFKDFPNLNHLMMEGKGKSTPMEYKTPGYVAEEVIETIFKWIKNN